MTITTDRVKIYHRNYNHHKINENTKVKQNTSTALSIICMKIFREMLRQEEN
ncbi:MAG: hypothetical protein ACLRY5_10985 [Zhenhengia sp.]